MRQLLSMFQKPNLVMSMAKVLIFIFGIEVAILTPYVIWIGKENLAYNSFLLFFLAAFLTAVCSKVVDSKYLSIGVKDGEK